MELVLGELQRAFPEARGNIQVISTESEFRLEFDKISQSPPDVIVMDIMVRWADPTPDLQAPPEDVLTEGFYTAGLRCEQMLAHEPKTRNTPVILYTVLEPTDLDGEITKRGRNVIVLPKAPEISALVELIRKVTSESPAR